MSDEEALAKFVEIRWSDNNGEPYCPRCGCLDVYNFRCRTDLALQGLRKTIQRDERDAVSLASCRFGRT
jgi:hypothetical protein